jgi:hypothetical protein
MSLLLLSSGSIFWPQWWDAMSRPKTPYSYWQPWQPPNVTQGYYFCAEGIWHIFAVITRISKGAMFIEFLFMWHTDNQGTQTFVRKCLLRIPNDEWHSWRRFVYIERDLNNAVKLHRRIASRCKVIKMICKEFKTGMSKLFCQGGLDRYCRLVREPHA